MKLRRLIAGALAAMMMFSFGACGKKQEDSTSTGESNNSSVESNKDSMFGYSDMSCDGIEGSVAYTALMGDKIAIYTTEFDEAAGSGAGLLGTAGDSATMNDALISGDDTVAVQTQRVYLLPVTGGTAELIKEAKDQTISAENMSASEDNIIIRYIDMANQKAYLEVIDKTGNTVNQIDISKYEGFGAGAQAEYVEGECMTKEGDIVLALNESVKVLGSDGNEKADIKIDTYYITGCGLLKDGTPFVAYFQDEAMKLDTIDVAGGKLDKSYDLSGGLSISSIQTGFGDYDVVFSSNVGEYGYKLESGEATKICDFNASDMNVTYLTRALMIDEKTILLTTMDEETGNSSIELYSKLDPNEIQDKTELTLMTYYAGADLKEHVIDFNKSHSDIRITIKDYSETDDTFSKMSADVAAGNMPDIYVLNGGIGDLSFNQCVSKGLFEDLIPYIEADSEISENDFVPSVLDAMKVDGKLYYTSAAFSVNTLITGDASLADKDGWNFNEMKEYVDSKPADSRLFESAEKSEILGKLFMTTSGEFVDWEKGECDFDSPEFKSLLEMANRGSSTHEEFDLDEYANDLKSGKQLFVSGYLTPDVISMYDALMGGKAIYIGYPNKEKQGVYASMDISYAISTTCKDKDAAWEFVRTYFTKEYQGKRYSEEYNGCPTRQDVFDMYMKAFTTTEPYTDEYGNEIKPLSGTSGFAGAEVENKPLTEAEANRFKDLVGKIKKVWEYDTSLFDIVSEETAPYFAGDKNVDEVAATIQNRASTYIQESK